MCENIGATLPIDILLMAMESQTFAWHHSLYAHLNSTCGYG